MDWKNIEKLAFGWLIVIAGFYAFLMYYARPSQADQVPLTGFAFGNAGEWNVGFFFAIVIVVLVIFVVRYVRLNKK